MLVGLVGGFFDVLVETHGTFEEVVTPISASVERLKSRALGHAVSRVAETVCVFFDPLIQFIDEPGCTTLLAITEGLDDSCVFDSGDVGFSDGVVVPDPTLFCFGGEESAVDNSVNPVPEACVFEHDGALGFDVLVYLAQRGWMPDSMVSSEGIFDETDHLLLFCLGVGDVVGRRLEWPSTVVAIANVTVVGYVSVGVRHG